MAIHNKIDTLAQVGRAVPFPLEGGASVPASRFVSSLAPPIERCTEWRALPNRLTVKLFQY